MPTADSHPFPAPHFRSGIAPERPASFGERLPEPPGAETVALGGLMMRGSDCLVASLQACTAAAGLSEARYRVLASLALCSAGECSQADLAERLLQSESNLSTLLERMSGDGLILRRRSETDRRRSLIRMAPAGAQALNRAERLRSCVIARLLRQVSAEDAGRLLDSLGRVVGGLERSLDAGVRRASGLDPVFGRPPFRTGAGMV